MNLKWRKKREIVTNAMFLLRMYFIPRVGWDGRGRSRICKRELKVPRCGPLIGYLHVQKNGRISKLLYRTRNAPSTMGRKVIKTTY